MPTDQVNKENPIMQYFAYAHLPAPLKNVRLSGMDIHRQTLRAFIACQHYLFLALTGHHHRITR